MNLPSKAFRPSIVKSANKNTGMKLRPNIEEDVPPQEQNQEEEQFSEILGKTPNMPLEAFPAPIRQAILDISACKGVAPDMTGAFFLGLGAACIGRARSVRYRDDWSEAANLYVLVAAETGKGKSHTQSYIFKEMAHMEAITKARYRDERHKYEEDMIAFRKYKAPTPPKGEQQCRERGPEMPKRPPNVQYMLDDSTLEAAVELLYDNPRGLVWLVDEFHGFFQSLDRYSGSKGGPSEGKRRLLSAWDGKTISMSRKSKDGLSNEIYVERATLSICGCIQPGLLSKVFSHDDLIQGQPQRFLYLRCPPQNPLMLPTPEIPSENGELIKKITRGMLGLAMEEGPDGRRMGIEIDMTDGARKAFEMFRNAMTLKAHGTPMDGFASKMERDVLRMALILHYMRHACEGNPCDGEVTFEDVNASILLADFFYAHAQAVRTLIPNAKGVSAGSDNEDTARRLAPVLLQNRKKIDELECRVSFKSLKEWIRAAKKKFSQPELYAAMDWLKVRTGKDAGGRFRLITPDILSFCEQLETRIPSVLKEDEDGDD